MSFAVRLYHADDTAEEAECLSLVLEREIYTPYSSLTAVFRQEGIRAADVKRIGLLWDGQEIFLGLADCVEQYWQGGVCFIRVRSRSFTALLLQNELEPGLHANLTIGDLVQGFYTFPHVTYENDSRTDYIYSTSKSSLWDSILHFVYKLTGGCAYTAENMVRVTLPADAPVHTLSEGLVTAFGTVYDTQRLMSHYHMEDISGTPNAYSQQNPVAVAAEIVRHRQIPFDRQHLSDPNQALIFRNLFSQRGWKARYAEYAGFHNEMPGDRASMQPFLDGERICRVRTSFGSGGLRTRLWVYEDGFFNTGAQPD